MSDYSKRALLPKWWYSNGITISADAGAGKSAAIRGLREFYIDDWRVRFISMGKVMREIGELHGFKTIEEFTDYILEHPDMGFDEMIDTEQALYGSQNHTVIESRLAHAFCPHFYHVVLLCPSRIRAERRQGDEKYKDLSIDEIERQICKRDQNDRTRYERMYPGSLWVPEDFDQIIYTDKTTKEEVPQLIIKGHKDWLDERIEHIRYSIAGD